MAALLNSALISFDAVLASITSASWEGLIQTEMEPSNKEYFFMTSLLNTLSGITILMSLQYFLTRSFLNKIRDSDAYGRLKEAERPLVGLYGVTFLSVLFRSWTLAIANLLTSLMTSFWIWIALSNGVDLRDEIRNTCSHTGYSFWLKIMSIVYAFLVSTVIAWLGTKLRVWSMQSQDRTWALTLDISSRGLGDTAGWISWYSINFIFSCLPEKVYLSWMFQISYVVLIAGFCATMFVYTDMKCTKDHLLLEKDYVDNSHHYHHPKWDKEEDEDRVPTAEEVEDMNPNPEWADNERKKEHVSVHNVWVSLHQEALLIVCSLALVVAYYLPLEHRLGEHVHFWSLGIACALTVSLTYLHWYCGIHLDHFPRRTLSLHIYYFIMELCPWIVSFAWMYLFEGWTHYNEWSTNLIFSICITLAISTFMFGVMNYVYRYLHGSGFAEVSWLFGVAMNDFEALLVDHKL